MDVCLSLSGEMVEYFSFEISQILIVLYPFSLKMLPGANFHPNSLFLFVVTETSMGEYKITSLEDVKLEFEFSYHISWAFNSVQVI